MRKTDKYKVLAGFMGICVLCGGTLCVSGKEADQEERKTVRIWAWDNTFNVKAVQMAEKIYESRHPEIDIQVESRERNEIQQLVSSNLAAKVYEELPEVVLIEDYQAQSMLINFSEEFCGLDERIDYDQFIEYKTSMENYKGNYYGLPFDSGTAVLLYRKDYIEAAGYTEQDMENLTWQGFMEIGEAVKEKTGKYLMTAAVSDLGLLRIMLQSTGNWFVGEDGKTVDIAGNQEIIQTIQTYRELFQRNLVLTITGWDQFVDAFQRDKVAAVVNGCWSISSIKANPDQSGLWRAARIPRVDGVKGAVNASNVGGSGWYVLKNSRHPHEAVKFLAEMFVEDQEFLKELAKEINVVYAFKDQEKLGTFEWEDSFFGNQKVFRFLAETISDIPIVNYGTHTYEMEEVMAEGLQNYFQGTPLEEVLEKVQVKAEAIAGS